MLCARLSLFFFFFKQKTAYELSIGDWSSDVCSSDLQELRLLVGRVDELVAAWAHLSLGCQEPIHGAFGGEVDLLIQEGGVAGRRRGILEAGRMEHFQDRRLFDDAQGTRVDACRRR